MAKKPHEPAAEPQESLEEQIRRAAAQANFTESEIHTFTAAAKGKGGATRAIGDGVLLGRFLEFIMKLLPVLLPIIIGGEKGADAGTEDEPA